MASQVICPHASTARLRIRLIRHSSEPDLNRSKCSSALDCNVKLNACSTEASGI